MSSLSTEFLLFPSLKPIIPGLNSPVYLFIATTEQLSVGLRVSPKIVLGSRR